MTISLCTAALKGDKNFTDVLIESVIKHSPLITEVIIGDLFNPSGERLEEMRGNLRVITTPACKDPRYMWHGHGLGLHAALAEATQEYVMFCDPDVFFFSDVAGFYMDLMKRYDLGIVGVSHPIVEQQCYDYFPCVINCLVKRDTLPDASFLQGMLRFRHGLLYNPEYSEEEKKLESANGLYLLAGACTSVGHLFPHPDKFFDCGCNLWLWSHQRNDKWVAFAHGAGYICKKGEYKSNFDLKDNFGGQFLFYHMRGYGWVNNGKHAEFREKYQQSLTLC